MFHTCRLSSFAEDVSGMIARIATFRSRVRNISTLFFFYCESWLDWIVWSSRVKQSLMLWFYLFVYIRIGYYAVFTSVWYYALYLKTVLVLFGLFFGFAYHLLKLCVSRPNKWSVISPTYETLVFNFMNYNSYLSDDFL